MKTFSNSIRFATFFLLWCALAGNGWAAAAPAFLKAQEVSGTVIWTRADRKTVTLAKGMSFPAEGSIVTGARSRVLLVLPNDALVSLGENSEAELLTFRQETTPADEDEAPVASDTEIRIRRGALTTHVRKLRTGSNYKVETPLGIAGVRGTTFRVQVRETLQGSVAGVYGIVAESRVQVVSVAATEGAVGFAAGSGEEATVTAGSLLAVGEPAHQREDGKPGFRSRLLTRREIAEINREVNIVPPKPVQRGGGGPRSPYHLPPTDERR
ncbi:hypothetical protein OPIT5_10700 [Opitutaceae bacterium TAV5]|nr:hypothetical protein OPIT5_10700 [Opitutaceae bacterium TAV5]